jgi:hypothetical protein
MVLGGGTVLIPSRHHGRFNEEECCEQGDSHYSQSRHTALEEFPIVLGSLCHFWCCHRDRGCREVGAAGYESCRMPGEVMQIKVSYELLLTNPSNTNTYQNSFNTRFSTEHNVISDYCTYLWSCLSIASQASRIRAPRNANTTAYQLFLLATSETVWWLNVLTGQSAKYADCSSVLSLVLQPLLNDPLCLSYRVRENAEQSVGFGHVTIYTLRPSIAVSRREKSETFEIAFPMFRKQIRRGS